MVEGGRARGAEPPSSSPFITLFMAGGGQGGCVMTSSSLKDLLLLIPHRPFVFCRAASGTFTKREAINHISKNQAMNHISTNFRPSMQNMFCYLDRSPQTVHVLKTWSTGWCYWEVVFY